MGEGLCEQGTGMVQWDDVQARWLWLGQGGEKEVA